MTGAVFAVVAAAVVGYAVGSMSPATWLARALGHDIRGEGSGNPGATNVGRVLGRKWGVLVAVIDILKGLLPTLAFLPFGELPPLVAGLAAVIGHCWSPWLKGRGGKGVATSLGAILGVSPLAALVVVVVFLVVFAFTRWVAVSSVIAAWALVVIAAWSAFPLDDAQSVYSIAWALAIAVIVLVRHRSNLLAKIRSSR